VQSGIRLTAGGRHVTCLKSIFPQKRDRIKEGVGLNLRPTKNLEHSGMGGWECVECGDFLKGVVDRKSNIRYILDGEKEGAGSDLAIFLHLASVKERTSWLITAFQGGQRRGEEKLGKGTIH